MENLHKKEGELCWYFTYMYNIRLWSQINWLFNQLHDSTAPSRNSSISMLWRSEEIKYKLTMMRAPGCTQVRWRSCAVQLKWPVTYHTRRYSKTDHLLHVQQYLLYGWLKWMRTFHVLTGMRVTRDERRDQSRVWVSQLNHSFLSILQRLGVAALSATISLNKP